MAVRKTLLVCPTTPYIVAEETSIKFRCSAVWLKRNSVVKTGWRIYIHGLVGRSTVIADSQVTYDDKCLNFCLLYHHVSFHAVSSVRTKDTRGI